MDPLTLSIIGGGMLAGTAGGIAQAFIGQSSASRAAAAALSQLDLAQQNAVLNLRYIQSLYQPYITAGTNALSIASGRIYSGTEQKLARQQQRLTLEAKVAELSKPNDFALFPNMVGEKASERKAAAFQQLEADRMQKLSAAKAELDLFNKQQADLAPLYEKQDEENAARMSRISTSLDRIAKLSDLPTSLADIRTQLQNDPVYQFRISEGERALNRAAAARGTYFSGAAMKQLSDFSLALTGEETDKYVNRQVQALSAAIGGLNAELGEQAQSVGQGLSLASLGLTAAQGVSAATSAESATQAQLAGAAAQTTASAESAKGAAVSQGIGGITGTIGGLSALALLTQPKVTTTTSTPSRDPVYGGSDTSAGSYDYLKPKL